MPLYILGDLFEAWIGDDDDAELGHTVAGACAHWSNPACRPTFCTATGTF